MTTLEWLVGAYERLSLDKRDKSARDDGASPSVARQTKDNLKVAATHGLTIHRHYTDRANSAYDETKPRPEFEELIRDLEAGVIDGIVCYNQDRLLRDPYDLEVLRRIVKAAKKRGRVIMIFTPLGPIDLLNENDLLTARLNAMVANKSSGDTSRRVTDQHRDAANSGRPVGHRSFGWAEDKLALNPRESEAIRDGADKLLAGLNLADVFRDWNEKGLLTTKGNKWTTAAARWLYRNPRLVGWRYMPGTKYTAKELVRDGHGIPVVGQWEPVLDVNTWQAVNAVLDEKAHKAGFQKGQKSLRKYLLSGLLRCGNPDCTMARLRANGTSARADGSVRRNYACSECKAVAIDGPRTEELIEQQYLRRLGLRVLLTANAPTEDDAPWDGDERLAEINRLSEELMAAFRKGPKQEGGLSGADVFPQINALNEERDELTRQRGQYEAAKKKRPIAEPERLLHGWIDLSIPEKRAALESELSGILIHPRPVQEGWARQFDASRIEPLWNEQDEAADRAEA